MSAKRTESPRTATGATARPVASDLTLTLAHCLADALLRGDTSPTEDQQRAAMEHGLGRTLTTSQARLLAQREYARIDVRALAERLPDGEATPGRRGGLTRAELGCLPLPLWRECAEWLLSADGCTLTRMSRDREEPSASANALPVERLFWRGERAGAPLLVVAVRIGEDALLDAQEFDASVAAVRATEEGARTTARVLVLSPAMPTVGARLAARTAGITLLAGAEVDALLARLAVAYAEEQARESENIESRASAAARARTAMLKALDDLSRATERASQGPTRKKRGAATSRAAVAEAIATLLPHLRALAQIGLAWETLTDEWSSAFGIHAERAGALPIEREPSAFADLAERAKHLRAIGLPALEALAATLATGELGYDAWRSGLCLVLTLHWHALDARLRAVEPAEWRDFSRARETAREAQASRLTTEYIHAAARLQKARADLASRAALDVPEM